MFFHKRKIGNFLFNEKRSSEKGREPMHRVCSQKVWNQKDNAISSSTYVDIITMQYEPLSLHPTPVIVMANIWKCLKSSLEISATYLPPKKQVKSEFLDLLYLHSSPTHYMQLYITHSIFKSLCIFEKYSYAILCVIYASLFYQSEIVNTRRVWNTALFCLHREETF